MDFRKFPVTLIDIHDFGVLAFNYPYVLISLKISKQRYPYKDTLQWISVEHECSIQEGVYMLMEISLQLSMLS